jgi:KAP family P-loop domain
LKLRPVSWLKVRSSPSCSLVAFVSGFLVGATLLIATAAVALFGLDFNPAAIAIAAAGLGVAGILKALTDAFSNPATKWVAELFQGSSYGERLGYMDEIRRDLGFLVRQLEQRAEVERRVLVLIDDLDRCEPEKAVEVLHAVNRMLNYPCFIVCMGMDARVVIAAIEEHYKGLLGEVGASGFEYLDKIVQIPFRIPEPGEPAIEDYVGTLLPTQAATNGEPEDAPPPAEATEVPSLELQEEASTGSYDVSEASLADEAPLGQRVAFRQEELEAFQAAVPLVRHNPRHVKRLINVYRLVRTIAEWKSRTPEEAEDARLILARPHGTVQWIVAASQWPYTTGAMVNAAARLEEEDPTGVLESLDLLPRLYEHIKNLDLLARETQERFDDELDLFEELLMKTKMTWNELAVIRDYTVNFNPAVTEQLRIEALRRQGATIPERGQNGAPERAEEHSGTA